MYFLALATLLLGFAIGHVVGGARARGLERLRVWRIFDIAFYTVSSGALTAVNGAVRGDYDAERMKVLLLESVKKKEAERRLKSNGCV